ncbi:O-antigen ligase family protein [Candidatus Enterovibrio escicola]|uniref:O-antigen ligase family protein n=1 Tax=Candidatus Enterovibrio escicola TaxID=1927127 RepID=UPI001237FE90|nr:O-antigen ligase family protein [Candidatus Enterovibrio escacola]
MKIKSDSFKRLFLFLSFFYYLGLLSFTSGMFGEKGDDVFSANASGSIANQIIGILLLLMSLVLLLKLKICSLASFRRQTLFWSLIVLWFTLSIYWSYAPSVSFRRLIAFIIIIVTAFCLVQMFTPHSLLSALVLTVAFAGVLGLIQAIINPSSAFISEGIRAGAFSGIYFDKNAGARINAYALIIGIGLRLYRSKLGAFSLLVIAVCLLMSRSATGLVMVTLGGGLMFLFKYFSTYSPRKNLNRLFIIIFILVASTTLVLYLYNYLLEFMGRDPNLTNRTIIWELMDVYIEAEFMKGYGFGAFWASSAVADFLDRWGFIGNAHSGYYEAFLHGGLIGFTLVIIMLIHSLYSLGKNFLSGHGDIAITAILFAIVINQIIVNYVGFIIINHNSFDMFFFLIAYFTATRINQAGLRKN